MESIQKNQLLINGFLHSVRQHPESFALDVNDQLYTYKEVHSASLKIAHSILKYNIEKNSLIAILASNSVSAYTGILGTLISGKAYVPLNKKNPVSRTWDMLKRSGASTLVLGKECLNYFYTLLAEIQFPLVVILPDIEKNENLTENYPQHKFIFAEEISAMNSTSFNVDVDCNSIAYLLFTSGSTGIPKGVPITNENVCAYLNYITHCFDFNITDKFSQTFPLAFDLSVHDLFLCWKVGACLCVPEDEASPALLSKFIREKSITVWFSAPSIALLLKKIRLLKENIFPSLRYSLFCGEALIENLAEAWQSSAPASRLINLYGPTETTIAISWYEWKKEPEKNNCINGIVSIGKIFETQLFCIVNNDHQIVTHGEKGELLLSGTQVSSGHFKDEDSINKYYLKLSHLGDNLWYKTGDLVMEDKENNLHFWGRIDSQVKINGFRVELQEVEHVLREAAQTEWVATVVKNDQNTLFAFVARSDENNKLKESDILNYCRNILPWYMIPDRLFFIEKMPLNSNGKIDRKQLIQLIQKYN